MTKLITIIILLQIQLMAIAQHGIKRSVSKEVKIELLAGNYRADNVYCKFKKNMTCKVAFNGPHSLVYKGTWDLQRDTIVCAYHHVNFILQGKNKELKKEPYAQKFVIVNNTLYMTEESDGIRIAFNREKEE
jgi:hypothetical protein